MLKQFRTYGIAVNFHRECKTLTMPYYLKNQLLRSSSSVALNLAEGSTKTSVRDQKRYYEIALGSLRESQAALDLADKQYPELLKLADCLGAHLYKLLQTKSS